MDENTSYSDFMEGFDETADYQTDSEDTTEVKDAPTETETPETETEESTETTEGEESENETEPETKEPEAEKKADGETFTLKVNKEEKTYSREEMIALAQKGADYDRVKEQLSQSREEVTTLQGKAQEQTAAMEVLDELAKDAGMELPDLLKSLRVGMLKKQGLSEDAANERLARMDVEKENASLKAAANTQESSADRAKREIAEFRKAYPEVELTKEVLDKLSADVQGGMPLLTAYQKYEGAQKDAQIAELQRQLAAEKQNKANAVASPGSQKDSGGMHSKSDFDSFMSAFQ